MISSVQSRVANHDAALELPGLLLCPKHSDEEEPEPPVHHPLKVTVEQVLIVSELQGLKFCIRFVIATCSVWRLVKHFTRDQTRLHSGHPLVEAVFVPPVLLDGAQRPNVGTRQAEHSL